MAEENSIIGNDKWPVIIIKQLADNEVKISEGRSLLTNSTVTSTEFGLAILREISNCKNTESNLKYQLDSYFENTDSSEKIKTYSYLNQRQRAEYTVLLYNNLLNQEKLNATYGPNWQVLEISAPVKEDMVIYRANIAVLAAVIGFLTAMLFVSICRPWPVEE